MIACSILFGKPFGLKNDVFSLVHRTTLHRCLAGPNAPWRKKRNRTAPSRRQLCTRPPPVGDPKVAQPDRTRATKNAGVGSVCATRDILCNHVMAEIGLERLDCVAWLRSQIFLRHALTSFKYCE